MSPRLFPATFHEPETAEYQWVFANGQVQVSPIHSHQDLLDHAQIPDDHQGPMAMGIVEVQAGLAGWSVKGNVSLRYLSKILQDYTKAVGWRWGGLIDHIDQVPIDDQFGPKKSMYWAQTSSGVRLANKKKSLISIVGDIKEIGGFEIENGNLISYAEPVPVSEALQAFAKDQGFLFKHAEYPGSGEHIDLNNKLKNNSPMGEDLELENTGDNKGLDSREPTDDEPGRGPWKTRDGKEFTDWGDYLIHVQELNSQTDSFEEDGKFPEAPNMDIPLPNNFTPRQPFVMPLASRQAALQFPPFEESDPPEGQTYAAFDQEDGIIAMAVVDPEIKEVLWSRGRRAGKEEIVRTFRHHHKLAAPRPKDQLKDPVPFIYDIDSDKLAVGHPGSRHSEIPGKFTPGGIVEGTYEPGGKVIVRTMTNMPFTTKHVLDLWYYSYPQMEVTSLWIEDRDGKEKRLG